MPGSGEEGLGPGGGGATRGLDDISSKGKLQRWIKRFIYNFDDRLQKINK